MKKRIDKFPQIIISVTYQIQEGLDEGIKVDTLALTELFYDIYQVHKKSKPKVGRVLMDEVD